MAARRRRRRSTAATAAAAAAIDGGVRVCVCAYVCVHARRGPPLSTLEE